MSGAVAESDRQVAGDRNIGLLVEELIEAHLALTSALVRLADRLDLTFEEVGISGFSVSDVRYRGWLSLDSLLALAKVAPMSITRDDFLKRVLDVAILWEGLQHAPLRNMVRKLGIGTKEMPTGGSLRLVGTLCQLATIARNAGYRWPDDSEHVVMQWNSETRLPVMRGLFALNLLRQKSVHATGQGCTSTFASNRDAFGIVPTAQLAGWGGAVDLLYET